MALMGRFDRRRSLPLIADFIIALSLVPFPVRQEWLVI